MKLYEIPNYLEKKVRRPLWNYNSYIYFKNGIWLDFNEKYYNLDIEDINRIDWEEYQEPKKKKKLTMYRYWFAWSGHRLDYHDSSTNWSMLSFHINGAELLETEIIKEIEVEE